MAIYLEIGGELSKMKRGRLKACVLGFLMSYLICFNSLPGQSYSRLDLLGHWWTTSKNPWGFDL